jgi:hypothetical protein
LIRCGAPSDQSIRATRGHFDCSAKALIHAIHELIALKDGNFVTVRASQSNPVAWEVRLIADPREGIERKWLPAGVNFAVREFLVAFGTFQNPSRHFFSPTDLLDDCSLGPKGRNCNPIPTRPRDSDNTQNHVNLRPSRPAGGRKLYCDRIVRHVDFQQDHVETPDKKLHAADKNSR